MGRTEPDQNSGQLKLKGGRGETTAWECYWRSWDALQCQFVLPPSGAQPHPSNSESPGSNCSSLGGGGSGPPRQGCQVKYRLPSGFHMHSKYFLSIGLFHKRNWFKYNWASKSGNPAGGQQHTGKSAKGDHVSLSTCKKCRWRLPSVWSTQGIKAWSIRRRWATTGSGAPGKAAGHVAECGPRRTVG